MRIKEQETRLNLREHVDMMMMMMMMMNKGKSCCIVLVIYIVALVMHGHTNIKFKPEFNSHPSVFQVSEIYTHISYI